MYTELNCIFLGFKLLESTDFFLWHGVYRPAYLAVQSVRRPEATGPKEREEGVRDIGIGMFEDIRITIITSIKKHAVIMHVYLYTN